VDSLQGAKIGVSRIGSGSYVMGYVLADQRGWLIPSAGAGTAGEQASPFSEFVVLDTFERLRGAVNSGEADFFMWEHFTSKRYYDRGEIRKVGEIYTPWSSWKIVASTALVNDDDDDTTSRKRVDDLLNKLNRGIQHFNENQEEAVQYISTELDYSAEDAREWLKTVRFPERTQGVDEQVISGCVDVLCKAGLLPVVKGVNAAQMIARKR
jgi:ABC-type nitrate/sulfonate/bicarbonate transport system substrate-binding protein